MGSADIAMGSVRFVIEPPSRHACPGAYVFADRMGETGRAGKAKRSPADNPGQASSRRDRSRPMAVHSIR